MDSIPRLRLHSQLLAGNALATPHDVVSHFGAVQAQDYLGALWAVGMRMRDAVESDIEKALAERSLVRCWPMRGTLHFVAAEDVRWMLELLAPRVLARHRMRLERDFELDARVLRRCRTLVERALLGGNALTRPELYAILENARIRTSASRGLHVLYALASERMICFGARRGKQPTFVLLDEWLPAWKPKPRDEALAELARRYFAGHGPATAEDFMWWTGLTKKEANEAITLAGAAPSATRGMTRTTAHLLPPFDEYTVAYKDRSAILDPAFAKRLNAGGGILNAVVIVNGIVAGTWRRVLRGKSVEIAISPFRELTVRDARAVDQAAARYARFLGQTVVDMRRRRSRG
ncbi:MAG TPA: winged helix DNA-binding domain-containing protein [Thermoanaerobaculia bacterium]|nr:winged helix DNA-binding domain-containing protein [Thermoanaerobaculia bacterium]